MRQKSLRERLIAYFKRNHAALVPKGELERLVMQHTSFTADNCGRRLRELAEDGILEVRQIRGHSHYKFKV